ncbi:hypothetical protein DFH28DRAFT_899729, partial [Melampsora americana]
LDVPTTLQMSLLEKIAIKLLEIIAHAAGAERLFSAMSATKTKKQAAMTLTNFKMILNNAKSVNNDANNKIKVIEDSRVEPSEIFSGPDDLDEFEQEVAHLQDKPMLVDPALEADSYDGFIRSFFDLNLFDVQSFHHVESAGESTPAIGAPGAWNPNEVTSD